MKKNNSNITRILLVSFFCLSVAIWISGYSAVWFGSEDEGFRLHTAWLVYQGYTPYYDFFDNQMPYLSYISLPVAELTNFKINYIRVVPWMLITIWILTNNKLLDQNRLWGPEAAFFLLVLMVSNDFTQNAVEFRPDLPALALGHISLAILIIGTQEKKFLKIPTVITGGFILSIACLLKPNGLLLLPGILVLPVIYSWNRIRPKSIVIFFLTFLVGLVFQVFIWSWVTNFQFLSHTLGTHSVSLPSNSFFSVLNEWILTHFYVIIGVFFYLLLSSKRNSWALLLLLTSLLGTLLYSLSPPNTMYSRHLIFLTVGLAPASGIGYATVLSQFISKNLESPVFILVIILAFTLFVDGELIRKNPEKFNLAQNIQNSTKPHDYVLTDFAYLNVIARRPLPPELANVSANLTYTGIINQNTIRKSFKDKSPSMIILHVYPNPWHIANIPGIDSIISRWFNQFNFVGIKIVKQEIYFVFHDERKKLSWVERPTRSEANLLRNLLKKYKWNLTLSKLVEAAKNSKEGKGN